MPETVTNLSPAKKRPFEIVEGNGIKIPIYAGLHHGKQSFILAFYAGDRRVRERASTIEDARKKARAKIAELKSGAAHIANFTPGQMETIKSALEILKVINIPLSQVAREYAEAITILDGRGSIVEAVRLFIQEKENKKIPARTLPQVVKEFQDSITTAGLSALYLRDCRIRLTRAAKAFSGQILDIKAEDIDAWLSVGKRSPRSINNDRTTLGTLFKFAQDKGYLPGDKVTAAKQAIRRKSIDSEIQILAPANLAVLLKHVPQPFRPLVAIGGLAGIRTAEIFRLDWTEINFEQGHIEIKASKAKTASRRLVPLLPALREWLQPLAKKSGRLWEYENLQSFLNAWSKVKSDLPVGIPTNALRHSYASYRMAELEDAAKVSLEMGNSPRKIF